MTDRYGLSIRAATLADARGLAELMATAGRDLSPAIWAERLDDFRHETGTILLAVEWTPPAGVVVVNWFSTLCSHQPAAQISTLLVGPGERRRGIGRLLLKGAAQAARAAGCGALHLQTWGDLSLQAFGKASGFEEAGLALSRPLRKSSQSE